MIYLKYPEALLKGAKTSDQDNCNHSQSLMTLGQSLILIKHIMNGNLYVYKADIVIYHPSPFISPSSPYSCEIQHSDLIDCNCLCLGTVTHSFNIQTFKFHIWPLSSAVVFNHMHIIHKHKWKNSEKEKPNDPKKEYSSLRCVMCVRQQSGLLKSFDIGWWCVDGWQWGNKHTKHLLAVYFSCFYAVESDGFNRLLFLFMLLWLLLLLMILLLVFFRYRRLDMSRLTPNIRGVK